MPTRILDSDGFAFFQRELEHIKAKTYDVLYPEIQFDKIFPVSTESKRGATEIVSRSYNRRGRAKVVTGGVKDIPRSDVDRTERRIPVRSIVDSYGYSLDEIDAARYGQEPLDLKRSIACRQTIEDEMNHIAFFGDEIAGLKGFFTAGIADNPAPDSGTGSARTWASKTPDKILADVNLLFGTVFKDSNGVERANRLGLPLGQWQHIMSTPLTSHGESTIASWIVKNCNYLKSIDDIVAIPQFGGVTDINGVSLGGEKDVAAVWTYDPLKLEIEIQTDVEFLPPQAVGLEIITIGRARFAGMNLHYPKSAYILTGI